MDTREKIEAAKDTAKGLHEGAAKLAEWAKEARELQEAGKALSDVQGVLVGMSNLGKISGGLMVVSLGLDIVLKLAGGPSTEEQTLTEVKKIAAQITSLSSRIDDKFDALYDMVTYKTAQAEISETWDKIAELRDHIDEYLEARSLETEALKTDGDAKFARSRVASKERELREIKESHCWNLARTMLLHCSPDKGDISIDLFKAMKADTFGDMRLIAGRASAYMAAIMTCAMGESLITGLNDRRNAELGILAEERRQDMAQRYQKLIDQMNERVAFWLDACSNEIGTDIGRFLKNGGIKDIWIDTPNPKTAAQSIGERLQAHWSCFDFLVVVYSGEAIRGWDHHGYIGNNTVAILQGKYVAPDSAEPRPDVAVQNAQNTAILIHWAYPANDQIERTIPVSMMRPALAYLTISAERDRARSLTCNGLMDWWQERKFDKAMVPASLGQEAIDRFYGDRFDTHYGRIFLVPYKPHEFLSLVRTQTWFPPRVTRGGVIPARTAPSGITLGAWVSRGERALTVGHASDCLVSADGRAPDPYPSFDQLGAEKDNCWGYIVMNAGDPYLSTHQGALAYLANQQAKAERRAAEAARIAEAERLAEQKHRDALARVPELRAALEAVFESRSGVLKGMPEEILQLAEAYPGEKTFGEAVYYSHTVLGLIALSGPPSDGAMHVAKAHLRKAANAIGSFEPDPKAGLLDMRLARKLMRLGEREAVDGFLEYLTEKSSWLRPRVAAWKSAMEAGGDPGTSTAFLMPRATMPKPELPPSVGASEIRVKPLKPPRPAGSIGKPLAKRGAPPVKPQ